LSGFNAEEDKYGSCGCQNGRRPILPLGISPVLQGDMGYGRWKRLQTVKKVAAQQQERTELAMGKYPSASRVLLPVNTTNVSRDRVGVVVGGNERVDGVGQTIKGLKVKRFCGELAC
jgi:hypothetical protein